ncbi:MAG: alkaline phosphatase family protein [Planctomycetes bacterium]|nr:alkaline phosphatase family protein [Planctomycetota bacterium]
MNRRVLRAAVLALACAPAAAQQAEPPRLVVLCSVDQLAHWVFEQARPHFAADGGFRRLLDGGAEFPACAYQHACTETGPGHATIGTGAPASVHGIVRNDWWSGDDASEVYCVGEQRAPLPGLPEGRNRGPGRLLTPTLGDGLKAHRAGSKVVSVAWKDRSAILMAGGSADAVAWFEVSTGNLVTNTTWTDAVPAWLTAFNTARAIDGFHGQVWDRCAGADAYADLVDDRPYELAHQNGSRARTLPQPLTGGKPDPDQAFYTQVFASPVGNTMVRLAAEAAVVGMELGADAQPDLLCIGFSSTDVIGHCFGPDSVEARDALLRLDRELATLLAFLDGRVGAGRYALFLTADHGIGPTPEWARSRGVDAGRGLLLTAARARAEKALSAEFDLAPPAGKRWIRYAGDGTFVLDPDLVQQLQAARPGRPARLDAARVAAAAAVGGGIVAALATEDVLAGAPGDDPLRHALRLATVPGRVGDVLLVVKPYWIDGTTPATHGSPHAYDREVVAIAYGAGAPAGVRFAQPITPGFGAVWFAALLAVPRPPGAVDTLPPGMLDRR